MQPFSEQRSLNRQLDGVTDTGNVNLTRESTVPAGRGRRPRRDGESLSNKAWTKLLASAGARVVLDEMNMTSSLGGVQVAIAISVVTSKTTWYKERHGRGKRASSGLLCPGRESRELLDADANSANAPSGWCRKEKTGGDRVTWLASITAEGRPLRTEDEGSIRVGPQAYINHCRLPVVICPVKLSFSFIRMGITMSVKLLTRYLFSNKNAPSIVSRGIASVTRKGPDRVQSALSRRAGSFGSAEHDT